MIINFENLENNIELSNEFVAVVEVENKPLFRALLAALLNNNHNDENQPYTIYCDDGTASLKTTNVITIITDVLSFDLNSKKIIATYIEKLSQSFLGDEKIYKSINDANLVVNKCIGTLLNDMNADFSISCEWNISKYLKAFDFSVEDYETDSVLNKMFQYISICSDLFKSIPICFVNAKSYLDSNEIKELYKYALYNKISMMMFESNVCEHKFAEEHKLFIDNEFDEIVIM